MDESLTKQTPKNPFRIEQIHREHLRIVYDAMPLSLVANFINGSILATLQWPVIEHGIVLAWLAAIWLLSAARLLLVVRFRSKNSPALQIKAWSIAAQAGVMLSAACWGAASYFLFAVDSLPHQVFLAFVIAGMVAGSVATLSALPWCAIAFILLSTVPLLYRFSQAPHSFALPMSLMILLFILMMIPLAMQICRNLTEMLTERFERQLVQQRDRTRNQVLELLATGASLPRILKEIVLGIEKDCDLLGSILLLSDDGKQLLLGAAPNLPDFYTSAVHGLAVGPGIGSCGTAAFSGQRVIVEDIQTHPYWVPYRDITARANLAACWSEPIVSAAGKTLGTFAIYSREIHRPTSQQLAITENAAHLAGIAIERSQTEEALQLAAMVYHNSSDAMMITDEENRILAINPAFSEITGYTLDEIHGENPQVLASKRHDEAFYRDMWQALNTAGYWQGEIWNRRKDGEEFAEWLKINTILNEAGEIHRRVALFSDITEKKEAAALIWSQANYDSLTNLPNRRLFMDRLEQIIKNVPRKSKGLTLLLIDLDRFKEVNNMLGHHLGDQLLAEVAQRINRCVRKSDTVARLGGDEFTVILTDLYDIPGIGRVTQSIVNALREPYVLGTDRVFATVSIGISVYPDDASSAGCLLRNADQAMYASKQKGGNCSSYFTLSMQLAAQERMSLIRDLYQAIADDDFMVYYQPIIDLGSGRIHKAEALLRWQHPQQGFISPEVFIPIAEEIGTIQQLGNRVFKDAAQQVQKWRANYDPRFQVSVNKSPMEFLTEHLKREDWVKYLLELGLSGESLVIEITEGVLLKPSVNVQDSLLSLRGAGVQLAIDDFGTGYSSLAYLTQFDIDYLKIDRSFVGNLGSDANGQVLAEMMVLLAHKLGMKVIAEGVENSYQLDMLKQMGCDYAQGYFFSEPVPAEEFENLLDQDNLLPGYGTNSGES